MNTFFRNRFNTIDLIGASAVSIYISRGQFVMALVIAIIGAFISLMVSGVFKLRAMNRQWQQLSDGGRKVEAIKKHRELFGSTLKEALDVVNAYESRLRA